MGIPLTTVYYCANCDLVVGGATCPHCSGVNTMSIEELWLKGENNHPGYKHISLDGLRALGATVEGLLAYKGSSTTLDEIWRNALDALRGVPAYERRCEQCHTSARTE